MALIIPTGTSTFGDSTFTEGARLRKYVLGQFRSDAALEWVKELRARLVKDELKYIDFKAARPRLREDRQLWARIERGVAQASIIIIDPVPVEAEIRQALEAEVGRRDAAAVHERAITEACATAIVATTPIAYLPLNLARVPHALRFQLRVVHSGSTAYWSAPRTAARVTTKLSSLSSSTAGPLRPSLFGPYSSKIGQVEGALL